MGDEAAQVVKATKRSITIKRIRNIGISKSSSAQPTLAKNSTAQTAIVVQLDYCSAADQQQAETRRLPSNGPNRRRLSDRMRQVGQVASAANRSKRSRGRRGGMRWSQSISGYVA